MSSAFYAELIALSDAQLQAEDPAQTRARAGLFVKDTTITHRVQITSTLIICGDCAGDHLNPRKTFLTVAGYCATCGGHSYVLASKFFSQFLSKGNL